MHHRVSSILPSRPKTSSAADDENNSARRSRHQPTMKRTASQTFNPSALPDGRDRDASAATAGLGSVKEGSRLSKYTPTSHSHSYSSLSQVVVGSYKQMCRRLSTSSSTSRRPSLSSATSEASTLVASSSSVSSLKPTKSLDNNNHHTPHLAHQDSAFPNTTLPPPQDRPSNRPLGNCFAAFRRFSSIHRRPAASGPSGDAARFNPQPPPIPAGYPTVVSVNSGGSAARASAAQFNAERREAEQTARFLASGELDDGGIGIGGQDDGDVEIKDNESGVGMSCSAEVESKEKVQEKRIDPITHLPAELSTLILSHLSAPSLALASRVSRAWHEAASSTHVWRHVFLRRFEPEVHVSPAPILMGGAGIGKFLKNGKSAPGQDWRSMYRVRRTIERRWKAGTPNAIYLNGHTDSVYCCQFDEEKIITGSRDRTIRIWSMKTYLPLAILGGPRSLPVPDTTPPLETHKSTVINHPSLNGTAQGRALYHIPEDYHEASILCLQYDDEIMVTGSSDCTCIVWDVSGPGYAYKPLFRLRKHTGGVLDVCLDKKHIISCSKDLTINIWDRATGTHLRTLTGHRGPVNAVQLRGNLLVSASGDGVAKLWELGSGACVKEFPSQDRGLAAVEFSDDARVVLAGGNDHVVYRFDAQTGQCLQTSEKHGGLVRSLFLDSGNGRVVSGSYDQSIRVMEFEGVGGSSSREGREGSSSAACQVYENWTTSWILSAKSDYRRVVATSQDGRAVVLDFGWGVEGVGRLVGSGGRR